MESPFDKFNTVPPKDLDVKVEDEGGEGKEVNAAPETKIDTAGETKPDTIQDTTPAKEEIVKDTLFEDFNKRFGTQEANEDFIKNLLGSTKKLTDYEKKIKEYETLSKSAEQYKKELADLRKAEDPMKYFASPESFIAEQLRKKYPTRNAQLLYEVTTTDVDAMSDFDVLVKEKQLFIPKLAKEGDLRGVLYKKYGIDADSSPEEWDGVVKTELAIDAAAARDRINALKKEIEIPQVVSREEKERLESESLTQKKEALTPLREEFSKFDKVKVGDIEYTVPNEYKEKLGDMFDAYFVGAGNEVTDENLVTLSELRDALFVKENLNDIVKAIEKDAQTKLQAKIDAELGNTNLPNTKTASEGAGVTGQKPGYQQYITDQQGSRVRNL